MTGIQQAVAACLRERTGVRSVCGRSKLAEYPLLAVNASETGTVLVDGGRQVEQSVTVTVTARADRTGDGNAALLATAGQAVLGGIPMTRGGEKRVLHPLKCETDGETLTFAVTVCLPVEAKQPEQPAPAMESLFLSL